jgi:hypothetical protein
MSNAATRIKSRRLFKRNKMRFAEQSSSAVAGRHFSRLFDYLDAIASGVVHGRPARQFGRNSETQAQISRITQIRENRRGFEQKVAKETETDQELGLHRDQSVGFSGRHTPSRKDIGLNCFHRCGRNRRDTRGFEQKVAKETKIDQELDLHRDQSVGFSGATLRAAATLVELLPSLRTQQKEQKRI